MKIRTAEKEDLPALEVLFRKIIENMYKNGIIIWNESYPYEEFAGDIENGNLYLITNKNEIVAAFGMYDSANGQDFLNGKIRVPEPYI
ncbi:MAG: hypothetical protein PHX43_02075 [Alphaproteobacteria bacterium]|nr:hypothetical protein [Alphaproteobacteria bacterium]